MLRLGNTEIWLDMGTSSQKNVTRILNAIDKLPLQCPEAEDELEQMCSRKPHLEAVLQRPFERREELLCIQK